MIVDRGIDEGGILIDWDHSKFTDSSGNKSHPCQVSCTVSLSNESVRLLDPDIRYMSREHGSLWQQILLLIPPPPRTPCTILNPCSGCCYGPP